MGPKTYIILINYRNWEDTLECLESVLKSDYRDFQAVVCDNGSGDGSLERIKEWAEGKRPVKGGYPGELKGFIEPFVPKPLPYVCYDRLAAEKGGDLSLEKKAAGLNRVLNPLVLIDAGENLGFAGGNNIAIRYALAKNDFDFLWLLNNDTVIPPDALSRLVEKGTRELGSKTGMIGCKLMHYRQPGQIQGVGGKYNPLLGANAKIGVDEKDSGQYDREDLHFDYVIGASMFITKQFVAAIGLMNEEYFLYYEELDWQKRAERLGWKSGYCFRCRVYHKEGGSIGTSRRGAERSELSDYYQLRNRFLFTKKYYPACMPTVLLSFFAVLFNRVMRLQFNRIPIVIKALLNLPLKK